MPKIIAKIVGARVSKQMQFFPGYAKPGSDKPVSDRLVIPFMHSTPGYKNKETGVRGEEKIFSNIITVWGPAAVAYAFGLDIGREFAVDVELDQYMTDYKRNGKKLTDDNGQNLRVQQTSMTAIPGTMHYGPESDKKIKDDIGTGKKLIAWNGQVYADTIMGAYAQGPAVMADLMQKISVGEAAYEAKKKGMSRKYTPGMTEFGNAKIVIHPNAVQTNAYQVPAAPGNLTYEMMKAKGWTDQNLFDEEGGKYRHLIPVAILASLIAPVVPDAPGARTEVQVPDAPGSQAVPELPSVAAGSEPNPV